MAQDVTQVRVGLAGHFYWAPVGTATPATSAAAWTGWTDAGFLDTSGPPAEEHLNPTYKDFHGWGLLRPVRTNKTGETLEWVVRLIQSSGSITKLAHGGGTVSALGGGDFKYTLPIASTVDEHAFGLEVTDGAIIKRLLLPRGIVVSRQPIVFRNDEMEKTDLTIRALAPAGVGDGGWDYIVSNDPAMAS